MFTKKPEHIPRAQVPKGKNKLDVEIFFKKCAINIIIKKVKTTHKMGEKCENQISDTRLLSRTYKALLQLNNKKADDTQFKNGLRF